MKEELTTLMHSEFFDDPQERFDILIMGAYALISKGHDKMKTLQQLGLSEQEYDDNVVRVMML